MLTGSLMMSVLPRHRLRISLRLPSLSAVRTWALHEWRHSAVMMIRLKQVQTEQLRRHGADRVRTWR